MRTSATIALLFAAVVVNATTTIMDMTTVFSGPSCSANSGCTSMMTSTNSGDPGFDVCCATINVYNGTAHPVSNVKQCFPQYLAMDSNGKNVSFGTNMMYTAQCTANVTSTSTSCTSETQCSSGSCCVTRGWSYNGASYNATSMVCRNSTFYLTENQFFNYTSTSSTLSSAQFYAMCSESANPNDWSAAFNGASHFFIASFLAMIAYFLY